MEIKGYKGKKNLIGKRLREIRNANNLTQADLTAKMQTMYVEFERESISRIECGKRFATDYELLVLSRIFGKPMEWFLQDEIAELDKEQES